MQKFEYEKPLIEIYLRALEEEDVLGGVIGTSPVDGGGDVYTDGDL